MLLIAHPLMYQCTQTGYGSKTNDQHLGNMFMLNLSRLFATTSDAFKAKLEKGNKWLLLGGVLGGLIICRWIKRFILIKYYQ